MSGVDRRWVGAAGGAAPGSLVNSRWVGSGYGRWVGGTFSDSLKKQMTKLIMQANISGNTCTCMEDRQLGQPLQC